MEAGDRIHWDEGHPIPQVSVGSLLWPMDAESATKSTKGSGSGKAARGSMS